MNSLKLLFSLQIVLFFSGLPFVRSQDEETTAQPSEGDSKNLCDNPVISEADRMVNGTVRLYRGGYYWDLLGMPDQVGHLEQAKVIDIPFLAPVGPEASILSCLVCNRKAHLYKFEQGKFWAWMSHGVPFKTTSKGTAFKPHPKSGFDTVFHNGKASEPLMIGLKGKQVFYYSTKEYEIKVHPKYGTKGYDGGKNGENFPEGVDASFTWPTLNEGDGYFVYLFKGDKYCRRKEKLESGKDCDQWRDNKQLFGCNAAAEPQS